MLKDLEETNTPIRSKDSKETKNLFSTKKKLEDICPPHNHPSASPLNVVYPGYVIPAPINAVPLRAVYVGSATPFTAAEVAANVSSTAGIVPNAADSHRNAATATRTRKSQPSPMPAAPVYSDSVISAVTPITSSPAPTIPAPAANALPTSGVMYTSFLPPRPLVIRTRKPRRQSNPEQARGKSPSTKKDKTTSFKGECELDAFTVHTISAIAGEDVAVKIVDFVQGRKCDVCILSATGSISAVCLRLSGGDNTYEGKFKIAQLTGSFICDEDGSRRGGITIKMTYPDGRVLGGVVSGSLKAAGPTRVVIATFIADKKKNGQLGDGSFQDMDNLPQFENLKSVDD